VVVPPTSKTIASASPVSIAAPRKLFVGPDASVNTGSSAAWSARITVPSFWLMNRAPRAPHRQGIEFPGYGGEEVV
jgi:hypothetical protein